MRIQSNLEKLRKRAGMTQEELGNAVGCSRQHIYSLEIDIRSASFKLLENLARVLKCKVIDLFEEIKNND